MDVEVEVVANVVDNNAVIWLVVNSVEVLVAESTTLNEACAFVEIIEVPSVLLVVLLSVDDELEPLILPEIEPLVLCESEPLVLWDWLPEVEVDEEELVLVEELLVLWLSEALLSEVDVLVEVVLVLTEPTVADPWLFTIVSALTTVDGVTPAVSPTPRTVAKAAIPFRYASDVVFPLSDNASGSTNCSGRTSSLRAKEKILKKRVKQLTHPWWVLYILTLLWSSSRLNFLLPSIKSASNNRFKQSLLSG